MGRLSEPPPELVSKEEMTVAGYLLAAVAIAVLAILLSVTLLVRALPASGEPVDSGRLAVALAAVALTVAAIAYAILGRWPGSVSAAQTLDLAASPEAVWDAIVVRDDYPGWKKIYLGVRRLPERGEVYRLDYAEDSACPRCKLPRDPDRGRWISRLEVLEARRPSLYRIRTFPRTLGQSGRGGGRFIDFEESVMTLQPLAGGGTRLDYRSTAVRPKIWMAFLAWLGRPVKEHLRSLQAHVEGRPDETLFGIAARRMQAARAAPGRCRCPEES